MGLSIQVWTQTPEKLPYTGGGDTGGGGPLVRQIAFRGDLQRALAAWLVELKRKTLVCDLQALQAQWALLSPAALREGAESSRAAGGRGRAQQVDQGGVGLQRCHDLPV